MIVVGHDSGDVVTYSLRVDEKGLGAGGNFFVLLYINKERERLSNIMLSSCNLRFTTACLACGSYTM